MKKNFGKFSKVWCRACAVRSLSLVNISVCNVYPESIKCLRVAWSIAAALVIACKYFETDVIMELFMGNGVVCTFVARWVKVAELPTLNKCREFSCRTANPVRN